MRRFSNIILPAILVLGMISSTPETILAETDKPQTNGIKEEMTPEAWMIAIVDIISRQWVPAYDSSKNSVKNLYMSYRVDDKGYIIYSKLAYTTGDVVLDKALEESFKKIVKLPPPPKALIGNKGYYDLIFSKGEDAQKSGTGVIRKKENALNYEQFQYSSGGRTPFYYRTDRFMMAISILEANDVIKIKSLNHADLNIWSMSVFDSLGKALPPLNDNSKKKKVSVVYEFNISGYGIISESKMIKAADMTDVDVVLDRILGNGGRLNPPPVAGKYYIMLEMIVNS
jgi:hypothetical protein